MSQSVRIFLEKELSGWNRGEAAWLVFCVASVVALSLAWDEPAVSVAAAVSGVVYTVLAGKGKISCFAFGLVNTPLYAWLAWKNGYPGDMALNIYYFSMMIPGWISWRRSRTGEGGEKLVRRGHSRRELALWGVVSAAAVVGFWAVLAAVGGRRPLCDAATNVLSVGAMMLTVRRSTLQWAMWIAVDTIEVFMWFKVWAESGNSVSLLAMWALFLVNGVYLWSVWLKSTVPDGPGPVRSKGKTAVFLL